LSEVARGQVVVVSDDSEQLARLERLNQDLSESLKRCRTLLHDYEVRLAANSNDPPSPDAREDTLEA
jgi:hypothetical protein